jgi:hypothetical protein
LGLRGEGEFDICLFYSPQDGKGIVQILLFLLAHLFRDDVSNQSADALDFAALPIALPRDAVARKCGRKSSLF